MSLLKGDTEILCKILYDTHRNGKQFCWVAAVCDGELQLKRIDYEEWEYNCRIGEVEINVCINAENTQKLSEALKQILPQN